MAEEAVLDGEALQLWELPARLHNNETMLREFFTSHFRFTPAARIKTVFFNRNKSSGKCGNSPCVGGEVTVVFSAREAVRVVLSRIIQHELIEQDKESGMELRRGYVYFGQDRLLVEGIIHLVETIPSRTSSSSTTNSISNSNSVCSPAHPTSHRNMYMGEVSTVVAPGTSMSMRTRTGEPISVGNDNEHGSSATVEIMEPLRITVGGTVVSNTTNNKNSMQYDKRENVHHHHTQESDWSSEENDTMLDNEIDNDDDDEEEENTNNNSENDENDSTQPVESRPTTRTGTSTGAVVLCMTFVCTFDQQQQYQYKKQQKKHREGGKDKEREKDRSREEENNLVVTPHLIYQLLRTTCFVRKVVMFRRDAANTTDGGTDVNNKRRIARALVEVGDEDGAKQVVQTFHGVTLELTVPTPKGKRIVPITTKTTKEEEEVEVEYRWRLYVRYESGPRTSRELNVPMNTNTTLSVTPQNLALMGPIFKRYWSEHKSPCNLHTNNNSNISTTTTTTNVTAAATSSSNMGDDAMVRHHIQPQEQYDNNNMMRREHDGYDEIRYHDRRKRNRESSRDERHHRHSRRRSHEKISSNKQRHRSRDRHSHHQGSHDNDVDSDIDIYHQKITVGEGATQRLLTIDNGGGIAFNYNPHIQQQKRILLQQQQQQLQLQQSRTCMPLNTLHEMRGNPMAESLYVSAASPPVCRAIYSKEHGRMYYVYRDPKTGVEVSSWEPYGN
ncbi:hypothetical protein LSM04_003902 [Trypanosoma melophagium]|uniref:uncharacterized protein n=1 Tax=Trypanosoma melophagium TaxID=715481 RepID=UPI003519DAE1|nr:hypothetical protein LSM04_003902 [Trypanosoma melophagium]